MRDVNPYAFEPAIAPHIAAEQTGVRIDLAVIAAAYARLAAQADAVVVEGAGGWRVPLNEADDMADLAQRWDCRSCWWCAPRLSQSCAADG